MRSAAATITSSAPPIFLTAHVRPSLAAADGSVTVTGVPDVNTSRRPSESTTVVSATTCRVAA
jgi:hypothetical protein